MRRPPFILSIAFTIMACSAESAPNNAAGSIKQAPVEAEKVKAVEGLPVKDADLDPKAATPTGHKITSTMTLAYVPAVATFAGKEITEELAKSVAGNRKVLAWGNCSAYQKKDGSYIGSKRVGAEPVACLYLVTGNEADFKEYFLLEDSCSSGQACLNGYTVDTRIDTKVTTNPDSPDKTLEVVQSYHESSVVSPTNNVGKKTPNVELVTRTLQLKATATATFGLSYQAAYLTYEIRDANNALLAGPETLYPPVASSAGPAGAQCAKVGGQAKEGMEYYYAAMRAVQATLFIGIGTAGGEPGIRLAATAVGANTVVQKPIENFGGNAVAVIAEGLCVAFLTPTTPGGGGLPTDPGGGGKAPEGVIDAMGCITCNEWTTLNYSTTEFEDGEVTVTGNEVTWCSQYTIDSDGEDSDNDGYCD